MENQNRPDQQGQQQNSGLNDQNQEINKSGQEGNTRKDKSQQSNVGTNQKGKGDKERNQENENIGSDQDEQTDPTTVRKDLNQSQQSGKGNFDRNDRK